MLTNNPSLGQPSHKSPHASNEYVHGWDCIGPVRVEIGIISKRAGASGSIQGRDVAAAPTNPDHLMKRINLKGEDKHCRARRGSLKETSNIKLLFAQKSSYDEERLRAQTTKQFNVFF